MKAIHLTQGKIAIVDDEDFDFLNQWKWYAKKHGRTFYAKRADRSTGKYINIYMHRLILQAKEGQIVDHRSGDGLDNQRANLRFCTFSQNSQNKRGWGSSKYTGVGMYVNSKKWQAHIKVNGKKKQLGYFDTELEAAQAYDKEAIKHHGEFAHLNLKTA